MNNSTLLVSDPKLSRPVNPCDVTVIVPAWNAEATLERAVDSALAQIDVRVEVIIIDDASSDNTLKIAKELAAADPRVTVIAQQVNQGPAKARNVGLAHAKGAFVTPLDSDDFMEAGRLATLLALANKENWDFVADDLWQIDDGFPVNTTSRRRLFSDDVLGEVPINLADFVHGNMSKKHGGRREIGFLKPLMRRSFLDAQDLRYREDMRLGEDYDFYARALLRGGRFCLTDPAGYIAVVRAGSLSGHHDAAALRALVAADDRLLQTSGLSLGDRHIIRAHRIETLKRWAWLDLIEAVRARDIKRAIRSFAVPFPVAVSQLGKLIEQINQRGCARLRMLFGKRRFDRTKI